jgi:hypothetical protein
MERTTGTQYKGDRYARLTTLAFSCEAANAMIEAYRMQRGFVCCNGLLGDPALL